VTEGTPGGGIVGRPGGRSSAGRALASQAKGRGFEPRRPLRPQTRTGSVFRRTKGLVRRAVGGRSRPPASWNARRRWESWALHFAQAAARSRPGLEAQLGPGRALLEHLFPGVAELVTEHSGSSASNAAAALSAASRLARSSYSARQSGGGIVSGGSAGGGPSLSRRRRRSRPPAPVRKSCKAGAFRFVPFAFKRLGARLRSTCLGLSVATGRSSSVTCSMAPWPLMKLRPRSRDWPTLNE
jgi:hypothetical protein